MRMDSAERNDLYRDFEQSATQSREGRSGRERRMSCRVSGGRPSKPSLFEAFDFEVLDRNMLFASLDS